MQVHKWRRRNIRERSFREHLASEVDATPTRRQVVSHHFALSYFLPRKGDGGGGRSISKSFSVMLVFYLLIQSPQWNGDLVY